MNSFQYVTAHTAGEAVNLVGKNGRYLAGGIDLLGEMKDYIVSPEVLVNVKEIGAEKEIIFASLEDAKTKASVPFLALGSSLTVAELAAHPEIKAKLPGLTEAAGEIGSPQIRNVATVAGNLLQHSRCWYYRQPDITCLKRGGSVCYAPEGENKYLSLFSGCACVTAFTSNLGVMLTALDATVVVLDDSTRKAARTTFLKDLYAEAWTNPSAHHSLKGPAFVSEIIVPLTRTRSAYRQMSEKSEFDWALVSCAAAGNVTDGKITDVRIALGAVAPVPYLVEEAHHFLEGKPLTDENAGKAADLILKDAKPLTQNGYKVPLARTLIRRTLLALNS